jgi:hypothetical protein
MTTEHVIRKRKRHRPATGAAVGVATVMLMTAGCGASTDAQPVTKPINLDRPWAVAVQPDFKPGHAYVADLHGHSNPLPKCEVDSGYEQPLLSRSGRTVVIGGCRRGRALGGAWIIQDGKRGGYVEVDDGLIALVRDDQLLAAENARNGSYMINRWSVRDPAGQGERVTTFGSPKVQDEVFGLDVTAEADRAVVVAGKWLPAPHLPQTSVWVVSLMTGTSKQVPGVTGAEEAVWGRDGKLIVQQSARWTTVDPASGKASALAPRPVDAQTGRCQLAGAARQGLIAWCPATGSLVRIAKGGKTTNQTTLKTKRKVPAEVSVAVDAIGW